MGWRQAVNKIANQPNLLDFVDDLRFTVAGDPFRQVPRRVVHTRIN